MTYILRKDWNDCRAGTRLFFQDGMYFYKTITDGERWLSMEDVEGNGDLFRPITALELLYHVQLNDNRL